MYSILPHLGPVGVRLGVSHKSHWQVLVFGSGGGVEGDIYFILMIGVLEYL